MDWAAILAAAGIPEPPGRAAALERVAQARLERIEAEAAASAARRGHGRRP